MAIVFEAYNIIIASWIKKAESILIGRWLERPLSPKEAENVCVYKDLLRLSN